MFQLLVVISLLITVGNGQTIQVVSPCNQGQFSTGVEQGRTICENCPVGQYTSDLNYDTHCTLCGVGKYNDERGQSDCVDCPVGFISGEDRSECLACDIGFYHSMFSMDLCKECLPGQYTIDVGSTQCTHCPTNWYQDTSAQYNCISCPIGWNQLEHGSKKCQECPFGTYGEPEIGTNGLPMNTNAICTNCIIGQYQDQIAQTECKTCPSGYESAMEQSSFCRQCPTKVDSLETVCHGWGAKNSTTLHACPDSKYSDITDLSTSQCLDCPEGFISVKSMANDGYDSCEPCPPGTGVDTTSSLCMSCPIGFYSGHGVCIGCQKGTYSEMDGSTSCTPCKAGTYTNTIGVSTCSSCPKGWSTGGEEGLVACTECQDGYSHVRQGSCENQCPPKSKTAGSNKCDTCTPGEEYNTNLQCIPCTGSQYKNVELPRCTECPNGYVPTSERDSCVECGAGQIPSSGVCTDCEAGKYQLENDCEYCPTGYEKLNQQDKECTGCPQGKFADETGSECKVCPLGYIQELLNSTECIECPPGSSSNIAKTVCEQCPRGEGTGEQDKGCQACKDNQGSNGDGICVDCPLGKKVSNNICTECGENKYQDEIGQSSCKNCATGRVSANGADSCGDCTTGKYSNSGGSCEQCPEGQYRGVGDPEQNCITCPVGSTASEGLTVTCVECESGKMSTNTDCTDCPPGSYGEAGVCVSCPSGYYQPDNGKGDCVSCGSFMFSPTGSVSNVNCKDCDATLYTIIDQGVCDNCPHGKIYIGQPPLTHSMQNCQSCPAGEEVATTRTCQKCVTNEFSDAGSYCQRCPTGFATTDTGSSQCSKCIDGDCDGVCPKGEYLSKGACQTCPSGYVSRGGYQNKCIGCTLGTYQPHQGKSNCLLCESGRFSPIGANNICHLCPNGQYQQEEGRGACSDCLPGKYNDLIGQQVCKYCESGQFTDNVGATNSGDCKHCPPGRMGIFGGKCVDCPESTWQNEMGQTSCKECPSGATGSVPYSHTKSTQEDDCFDINGITSYVFGMKDDGKRSQSLETSCEIRPNMVLYCPSCTCNSDVRDGYWAGPLCDECRRGFAGGQVGKCLIKCPGYDGVHDSTMCNGNGKCWFGKHGSGECLCGGKNVLDSTSANVVVSVKTCPAGQKCPGYGTDTVDVTQYKPLYYQLEYRQYSVFVLQKNTHTPARGHMWFERFSPQNIYENVCSTCIGKYDKTPYTEIGYFKANNSDYVQFNPRLQLENGFHGENCQYECAACLNNGKCFNTPHSFYYNYAIENVIGTSTPVFLPQTQCICSSSIYDGDAMCCPHGFEPYVYFGKRDVQPYFQYTALPLITNVVNRVLPYWTDEDMWLNSDGHGHTLSYRQPYDNKISVSNINQNNQGNRFVQKNYDDIGPYTKHTFYGTEQDICRACPGLFGKGVKSRSTSLNTASDAEDYWWDSSAIGKKCNGVGVCDFYSQQSESSVLFMGKYELSHGLEFTRHRRFTSCREIVNQMNRNVRKLNLADCINETIHAQQSSFVYSESYKFVYNNDTMSKTGEKSSLQFDRVLPITGGNKKGFISTTDQNGQGFWTVESPDPNYVPPPDPNGDYTFHPWNERDCQITTSPCVETDNEEYSLYRVGQTGQGAERLDSASHDRFDTCLTYDDGTFKTKLGNYITKTYENGEDPFLGSHCPKGHFCSKTGIDTIDTVGFKEACPAGYFQPDLHQTRTTNGIQCSKLTNPDASCNENEATLKMDFIDKICQRCQPNEYAPEGSAACTACPVGRVKKLSGNIDPVVLENMYNIPIPKGGTYWYYMEDETGLVHSDCALVPNGIIHVPDADHYMDFDNPRLLPVFPCPFTYSSQPGTFVVNEHDSVVRLLSLGRTVISAPYTQVDDNIAFTQASQNGITHNPIAAANVYTMNHQGTEWIVLMKANGTQGAVATPTTDNSVVDPNQVGYQYMKESTFKRFKSSGKHIRVRAWNSDTPELYMECTLDKHNGNRPEYYNNWKATTDCIQTVKKLNTGEMISLPLPDPYLDAPIGSGFTYTSTYNSINPRNAVTGNSIFTKSHTNGKWTTQPYGQHAQSNIDGHYGVFGTEQEGALIYAIQPRSDFQLKNRELYAEAQQKMVKDYCFACPSSSMTGPGSTICSTCYQDRISSNTKQIIQLKTEGSYQLLLPTSFSLQPVNNAANAANAARQRYANSYPRKITHSAVIEKTVGGGGGGSGASTLSTSGYILKTSGYCDNEWDYIDNEEECLRAARFLGQLDNDEPSTDSHWRGAYDGERIDGCILHEYGDIWFTTNSQGEECGYQAVKCICKRRGTIVSGFSTRTLEAVYLAEVTMFCNYFDPAYVAIQLNIPTTNPVGYEHTCIKAIENGGVANTILYETIGNTAWTVEFPLCEGCPSGRYQSATPGICDACEAGKYTSTMAEAEQRECQPCGVGRFNTQTESQSCESCVPGKYQSQVGKTECTKCDEGKYEPQHGQANCKDCETGFYMEDKGSSTACKSCGAGKHWKSTTENCEPCTQGKFTTNAADAKLGSCKPCVTGRKHVSVTQACTGCGSGQYQDQNEQTSCKECLAGQFQNQGTQSSCKACDYGQYQTQTRKTSCVKCAVGTQYEKKGSTYYCKACRKGKYTRSKGNRYCAYCPPGQYKGNTGAGGCSGCNYGSYQDKQGQQSCKLCAPGMRTPYWASKSCQKCPVGNAMPDYGATWCDYCAPGKIAHSEGQKTCGRCRSHNSGGKLPEYQDQWGKTSCKTCSGTILPKSTYGHWGATGCKKKATPSRRRRSWFRT